MIDATERAYRAWQRIQRNPTSLTLKRGSTMLAAQTVRITFDSSRTNIRNEAGGQQIERAIVVFGVQDHPTITTTDIRQGDRFAIGKIEYEIYDVLDLPGSVQAYGRRVT